MKNKIQTILFAWSLALFGGDVVTWSKDKDVLSEPVPSAKTTTATTKDRIYAITSRNLWADTPEEEQQKIKNIFLQEIGRNLDEKDIEKLTSLLQKKEVKDKLYTILKEDQRWAMGRLILALLLWIGYGYAYLAQIVGQIKEGKEVNVKSFITFWSISGAMMVLNGFDPWSLVYFESFVLAFISVAIDKYNSKHGRHHKNNLFKQFITNVPLPMSQYTSEGFPLEWNPKMEEETGFSHAEIIAHYNKKKLDLPPERWLYIIMELLYKGENLKKVERYLERKSEGYTNVAFTMDIKFGERTFSWSIFPDKASGGDIHIAKHLTDAGEIRAELKKTEELLTAELTKTKEKLTEAERFRQEIEENSKRDELTGVYNLKAFNEDMNLILREYDVRNMIMAKTDIDDFKVFNDRYGHETWWDIVLKKFAEFIQANLYRKGDKLYRVGGDEFIILLESDDFDGVVRKLNNIRHNLSQETVTVDGKNIPLKIGSSWGVARFTTGEFPSWESIKDIITAIKSEADEYMYVVKHYKKYLGTELIAQRRIGEDSVEKNGVAKIAYDPDWTITGVEVFNEHGNFTLTLAEFEVMRSKMKDDIDWGKR